MTEQATHTIRVLLAEDDDNARTLLVDLLNTLGHVVVAEVATGREAYERAHELIPDVVLLDVHMPDGSGIEAAERITRDTPGVAVVLFSGDQALVLSDRDVEATSAIAFLPKPAPPRVLDSTIRLAAMRAKELSSARKDAESSKQQLENRKVIERAKGILMKQKSIAEDDAYKLMRDLAMDRNRKLIDVAQQIIDVTDLLG